MNTFTRTLEARIGPAVTAIVSGGLAGLIAILTLQLMMAAQHLIWNTAAPEGGAGPVRIAVTILIGGGLLILLAKISPSETVSELLDSTDHPLARSNRKILLTALAATVAVGFGGAIGPEAGLLAVIMECSAIVGRKIARSEEQARAIAHAGVAGALGGLYASPPAAAAMDGPDDGVPASRLMSFIAGISGFLVFVFVAKAAFNGEGTFSIPLPDSKPGEDWLIIVPVLVGGLLGVLFRVLQAGADRVAAWIARPWLVTLIGTALFAALAAAIPLVRFSGHEQLHDVDHLFDQGAAAQLWLLAFAKIVAVVLCLSSGWRGGEIFPLIFVGAAAGSATALLLPDLDPAAAFAGALAATITVGWRRPLAALLLLLLLIDLSVLVPVLVGVGAGIALDRLVFPDAQGRGEATRDDTKDPETTPRTSM